MNITPIELLIAGVLLVVLFRLLSSRRKENEQKRSDHLRPVPKRPEEPHDDDAPGETRAPRQQRRRPVDMYENAQSTWDMLSSDGAGDRSAGPETSADGGMADQLGPDFLEGAKAMYARIHESWDKRDLDDIAVFTTPELQNRLKERAMKETRSPQGIVLQLRAEVVGLDTTGSENLATVRYEAQTKDSLGKNDVRKETWTFVRPADQPDAVWKLKDMG
jgi:predicted lipid-binding transport protein (Tim44 family)